MHAEHCNQCRPTANNRKGLFSVQSITDRPWYPQIRIIVGLRQESGVPEISQVSVEDKAQEKALLLTFLGFSCDAQDQECKVYYVQPRKGDHFLLLHRPQRTECPDDARPKTETKLKPPPRGGDSVTRPLPKPAPSAGKSKHSQVISSPF